MKKTLRGKLAVAIATAGILSTMAVTVAGASATLNGDLTFTSSDGANSLAPATGGSSFDEPFFNAAIPTYMTFAAAKSGSSNAPQSIPLYTAVGSTSGKKGVVNGTYAIGASDVPMGTVVNGVSLDASIITNANAATTLNSYVQVPVVLGGVGMMYNLPSLQKHFKKYPVILNSTVLASIYDGKITNWDNPAICKLNPKIVSVKTKTVKVKVKKNGKTTYKKVTKTVSTKGAMPNLSIVPVFRADGSGTSFIFADYLHQTQGAAYATAQGTGTQIYPSTTFNQGQLPTNALGGQKNAGVAADVEQTTGAIGYVEYSYILLQHTLPAARIINAAHQVIGITSKSIAADAAAFASTPPAEGGNGVVTNFSIVNGTQSGDYPIAGYSWAIVRQDWNNLPSVGGVSGENAEKLVAKFLDWAVQGGNQGGQKIAQEQGYVPLPSYVTALAEKQVGLMTYNGASLGLN